MRKMTVVAVAAAFALGGCGGGGSTANTGSPRTVTEELDPAEADGRHDVTITTRGGTLYVDKLELEFNRRRGIHAFYGFFEDHYDRLDTVYFSELDRIEIKDTIPLSLFDQIILGREDQDLRADQIFETRLVYKDQSTTLYYAIIPKLRGEKDFQLWELTMTNNSAGIETIEFDR